MRAPYSTTKPAGPGLVRRCKSWHRRKWRRCALSLRHDDGRYPAVSGGGNRYSRACGELNHDGNARIRAG